MGYRVTEQLAPNGQMTTPRLDDSARDNRYLFAASDLAADRTVTFPLLTANASFVFDSFLNVFSVLQTISAGGLNVTGGIGNGVAPVANALTAFSTITGAAAATSLSINGQVTGGVAAQRDIVFQTGNAANPQVLATRLTIGSNAATAVATWANVTHSGFISSGLADFQAAVRAGYGGSIIMSASAAGQGSGAIVGFEQADSIALFGAIDAAAARNITFFTSGATGLVGVRRFTLGSFAAAVSATWTGVNAMSFDQAVTLSTTAGAMTLGTTDASTVAIRTSNVVRWTWAAASPNVTLAAAADIIGAANVASMVRITDGTTAIIAIDSRNTVTGVSAITFVPSPPTIVSAAGTTFSNVTNTPGTITLTGGVAVTALNGLALTVNSPTVTSAAATTVTTASTVIINGPLPAGVGPVTFTNSIALSVPTYATTGTTASGIRVAAPTGAATNYAFFAQTGLSAFQTVVLQASPLNFTAGVEFILGTTDAFALTFKTNGTARVSIATTGQLYPATDAAAQQSASGLFAGTGAPNNANGNNGDIYFRSDGGALTTIYQRRAGAWVGIV